MPLDVIEDKSVSADAKVFYARLSLILQEKGYISHSVHDISIETGIDPERTRDLMDELNSTCYLVPEFDNVEHVMKKYALHTSRDNPERNKVYLIQLIGTNRYKIGFSRDPNTRALQIGNHAAPVKVIFYVYGDSREERYMHNEFKDNCIGGEWFEFDEKELGIVVNKMKEIEQK